VGAMRVVKPTSDPWAVALVWGVCLVGGATWLGAIYVAGHFVLKYW
jgi:hypothetical protein